MTNSYFTSQKAMGRFFYISGLTADSFYSESGQQEDIEWMVYKELKRNGYERIVFYDRDWKLYCYDDESFQLLNHGKRAKESMKKEKDQNPVSAGTRRRKGLKMGKWENQRKDSDISDEMKDSATKNAGKTAVAASAAQQESKLHNGMMDNVLVYRQIDACMRDGDIKTAIVINDASDFMTELGEQKEHSMDVYTKLDPSNENIIVYIYPDQKSIPILNVSRNLKDGKSCGQQDAQQKELERLANVIEITSPNALELKRMLNYFRLRMGLNIRMKDMEDVALEIRRYMMEAEPKMRIKELYHHLKKQASEGKRLNKDNCHELFGTSKHLTGEERLNQLIGMETVKKELLSFKGGKASSREKVQFLSPVRIRPDLPVPERKDMLHVILTGNPGTGKTTVAKTLGQLYYEMGYLDTGHVVEVDREGLVAGYVGQTAIKTRQKIKEALGGVLFIDEAYSLRRNEDDHVDFGQEAIDTLVKAMDEFKGRFIVVAAGYEEEMQTFLKANPGLSGRFRLHLHIDDYTPEEIAQIVKLYMTEKGCRFSESMEEKFEAFCENWVNSADESWDNGRAAHTLAANLNLNWSNDRKGQTEVIDGVKWKIIEEHHISEKQKEHLRSADETRQEALKQLHDLIGLKQVKRQIERIRKKMIAGDKKTAGHYLFVGNPGTGKTTVARIMGKILKNLGVLKRGHLVEYTAGELVAEVQKAIQKGKSFESVVRRALDGVLFIDEAYQLLETNVGQKIISDLVPYMENNRDRICIICAGYEDDMKKFVEYNVGLTDRFSEQIRFENYSAKELTQILGDMLAADGYEADEEYMTRSLNALSGHVKTSGGARDFGNARYLRDKYIPHSLDAKNDRLFDNYGDQIPEEEKRRLTGEDIPVELKKYANRAVTNKEQKAKTAMEEIDSLIGFEGVKEKLRKLMELGRAAKEPGMEDLLDSINLNWILKGNPGTGKTTLAKILGRIYKEIGLLERGHVIKVTRADLVGRYIGHTAQNTKEYIEKAMGGVLFVEEAYTLKRSADTGKDFGQEAIDTLMEAMSDKKGEFAVIFAGYPKEMDIFIESNPGIKSRLKNNEFVLDDYTGEEVARIFEIRANNANFRVNEELMAPLPVIFDTMKKKDPKDWGNGRAAENLEEEMRMLWVSDKAFETEEDGTKVRLYVRRHLPKEYEKYLTSTGTGHSGKSGTVDKNLAGKCSIKVNTLPKQGESFDYETDFGKKEQGLVMIRADIGPDGSQGVSNGSGSIITSDGYILTCNHVIDGCSDVKVRIKVPGLGTILWLDADVVVADPVLDAAILKVNIQNFPALPMRAAFADNKIGESIFHLGYPFGVKLGDNADLVEPSLFQGHVSSIQTKNGRKRINADMAAKRGCSGGPVFSKQDGTIIGILCGSQTEGDASLMEEINYILPVSYIWENVLDLNQ